MCFSSKQKGFVSGDLSNPSQHKLPGCLALRHTNCFGKGGALDFLTLVCTDQMWPGQGRREKSTRRAPAKRKKDLDAENQAVVQSRIHKFDTKVCEIVGKK